MFCPECRSEYRPGFIRCSDCGVALVDHLPVEQPPKEAPVVVRNYATQFEAEVAKSALESAGIDSMIRGETRRDMFGVSARGVDLLVRPDDVSAALDFLNVEGIAADDDKTDKGQ